MPESSKQTVSIILPTYNRARFLPEALAAIRNQYWSDWELIIVDDGSTDNTHTLVAESTQGWEQSVRYVYQENQGAYGARNTGLNMVRGQYVAFYDSDDVWLPHHLSDCVNAMETYEDVDWVYGSCRMVDFSNGRELSPTTFYLQGQPRPFMNLHCDCRGNLRVIVDPDAAHCQILHGLYSGLQNSVIRTKVFTTYRFDSALRNEAEDQVVVIWALVNGCRMAYLDNVHVEYRVHESNSSLASVATSADKRQRLQQATIAGFERLRSEVDLDPREQRALAQRLGREYFWNLGMTHWKSGNRSAALHSFRKGLGNNPWNWRFWKTYMLSLARTRLTRSQVDL